MNRRGFIRSAIAAVAGVALAPLTKIAAPVKKLVTKKLTKAELLSIMQAEVNRIMVQMQRELNKQMFSESTNELYKALKSGKPIRIAGGDFLNSPPYGTIKSGIKLPPSLE